MSRLAAVIIVALTTHAAAQDQGYARRFYPSAVLSPYLTIDGPRPRGAPTDLSPVRKGDTE